MDNQVNIAVRPLVEYVYRSGSLDAGFRTTSTLTEGTKAHQKVQKQYKEQDQKEVYLQAEIPHGNLLFMIDGRCDGLFMAEDGAVTIDEIKSTRGDLSIIMEDTYPVHWAQAKCYAYMYARQHGNRSMKVQLTYFQVDTEQQKSFLLEAEFAELESFVTDLVSQYAPYAELLHGHRLTRDLSIEQLSFPFPAYREGQRKLAGSVYKSIEEGVRLFAKAPTGTGKTISTTFPVVKAIGQGILQRLFYLTARTTTRTAAEDTFGLMQAKGLHMHVVTITAKEKICFQDEMSCRKEDCPYADGYYDRINGAMLDMLSNETLMSRDVIERYARKHRICPFEFSLDAAYASDAVICDYNYIFDPRVSLKRMFAEQKNQTALLIDEAHNLVDRAREMFSSVLLKSDFLALQRHYKELNPGVHQAAKAVNAYFIKLKKQVEDKRLIVKELPEELLELVEAFALEAEKELIVSGGAGQSTLLLDAYFAVQSFIRIGKLYDERYVTYAEITRQDVRLKLFCLDPSHLLREMGKGYRSHIYFSATLSPMPFYRDMLGASEDDYSLTIPSPFSEEQLEVRVHALSTRYVDREATKGELARLLKQLLEKREGNYLFFFPSYAYMNQIYEAFIEEGMGVETLLQQGNMSEEERDNYLSAFQADHAGTLAGFAVMGGIFSEGIDLVGDRLTGVVIVGVGLPQLGLERDIIKQYFNESGKNGFDYAYVFPGMNKVLQAGGRLIRSEEDRGVLVLVDDRYLQPHYARLLPDEWGNRRVIRDK